MQSNLKSVEVTFSTRFTYLAHSNLSVEVAFSVKFAHIVHSNLSVEVTFSPRFTHPVHSNLSVEDTPHAFKLAIKIPFSTNQTHAAVASRKQT